MQNYELSDNIQQKLKKIFADESFFLNFAGIKTNV